MDPAPREKKRQVENQEIQANVNNEDRISELPDCILSHIQSNLTMKDMVKSSAISTRWRHLRPLSCNLNFDVSNMFGSKMPSFSLDPNNKDFEEYRLEFMRRVDGFMQYIEGIKIICFKVEMLIDKEVANNVDPWISYAVASGVEEIQLLLSKDPIFTYEPEGGRHTTPRWLRGDRYTFPHWLIPRNSTLKHLRLEECKLAPTADFPGFNKLKTLHLKFVNLGEEFGASFFANCLLLQELTISRCKYTSPLKIFSTSLRKLEILGCDVLKVEIYAENLTTFECTLTPILMINLIFAPRLKRMFFYLRDIEIPYALSQMAVSQQLESLAMYFNREQIQRIPSTIVSLRNLKQLELFICEARAELEGLFWVLTFLNASPLLEKIFLTLEPYVFYKNQREIQVPCGCIHKSLKQVEMIRCTGNWYEIEFVMYILKNAIALDRVVFNPKGRRYRGGGDWSVYNTFFLWLESGRDAALKSFQNNIPTSVQLVIL